MISEVDKRANIYELLNHLFILNYAKDRNYIINCIDNEYNYKYSKKILNIDIDNREKSYFIDESINNNRNNCYLSDKKKYLYKNYNSDSNLLGMKSSNKNKKNIKNYKYKTNKSINNNYIKKKILFTPKISNENKITYFNKRSLQK